MSYALISDDLLLQLEGAGVSRDARLLHLEAIVYSCTALTDGAIKVRLARFSDAPDIDACAQELIDAGLWTRTDDGFTIEDYLEHQRPAEEVERKRAEARTRADRYRRHKRGDHSQCIQGRYCPDGALSHASRVTSRVTSRAQFAHDSRDVRTPILSLPSQKEGKESESTRPTAPDGASGRELTDKELAEGIRSLLAEHGWQIPVGLNGQPVHSSVVSPDGRHCMIYDLGPDEPGVYLDYSDGWHWDGNEADPNLLGYINELKSIMKAKRSSEARIGYDRLKEGNQLFSITYPLELTGMKISTQHQQDEVMTLIEDYVTFISTAFDPYIQATQAQVNDDE